MQSKQKLIVFPTSRAIREYIQHEKQQNTLLPFCLTIDDFFKKSFTYSHKKLIDEEQKLLFLKESINFDDFKKLGISSKFTHFLKQSDYIFRFFSEVSSEKIDIESISDNDTYEFYKEHLQILQKVKDNYIQKLEEYSFIDKVNEYKYLKINNSFLDKFESIELFFEGYFTKVEFDKILEISKILTLRINLFTNEYNKKSFEIFENIDLVLEKDNFYKLDISNKKVLEKTLLEHINKDVEIKGFNSRVSQIAYIKTVVARCVEEGINPSNIALILPDESFAKNIRLFDDEGYFNYAMGIDIFNSKTYKLLHTVYKFMNEQDIKNSDANNFYEINRELIDSFKNSWDKKITIEFYEMLITSIFDYESNKELKEKLNELFYRLSKLFFSTAQNILVKEAIKIIIQKISKLTLDDINSGKVTVMGLLESRTIKFDAVIICDFNESFIPKASLKDKFLSTNIKQKANLPTLNDRENLQKYYYKRLVDNSKKVFVSYVHNDTNSISRFANELFNFKDENRLFDNNYKHILYKSSKIEHFDDIVSLDIDLSKLQWSATSLKIYLQCKRKFYLQYIAKLKEHDISLKPKGYELGDIVHKVLYEYYENYSNSYDDLLRLFDKYSNKNPFLTLDLEVWKKRLKEFFVLEQERLKCCSVIHKEMPFNFEYQGIEIKGVIDRVDKCDDRYLVLDYKTSSSLKVDTLKNYEKSSDFQLEFYYLAILEQFKTSNIETYYYDLNSTKLLKEIAVEEKLDLLRDIFVSLKTQKVVFDKCEEKSTCQFCHYNTICNR